MFSESHIGFFFSLCWDWDLSDQSEAFLERFRVVGIVFFCGGSINLMAKGGFFVEKIRRCLRTLFFMVAMLASLLVSSLPVLVAIGDMLVPCILISSFTCVRCYGFKEHMRRYAFKSSLTDIPFVSMIRSLIIICMILISINFALASLIFPSIYILGR